MEEPAEIPRSEAAPESADDGRWERDLESEARPSAQGPQGFPEDATGLDEERGSASAVLDLEEEDEEDEDAEEQDDDADEEPNADGGPASLVPVSDGLLARVRALFVASGSYAERERSGFTRNHGRIFLVHGPEHAGKFTCAASLALALKEAEGATGRVFCYRRSGRDPVRLCDFVAARGREEECVYILQDAPRRRSHQDELQPPELDQLDQELERRRSWLILTLQVTAAGDLPPTRVPAISATVETTKLEQVFTRHRAFYDEDRAQVQVPQAWLEAASGETAWSSLASYLRTPSQIDELFAALAVSAGEAPGNLVAVARTIAGRPGEAHAWFGNLRIEEKLFAMLGVLVTGVTRSRLYELFVAALTGLRADGLASLPDPRLVGHDDLLERVRVKEEATHELTFKDRQFRDEAWLQVRNHNHLLWSLVPVLVDAIESHRAPEEWELRRSLAAAVGRVGAHHQDNLRAVLVKLAQHEVAGVAVAVGHALGELCQIEPDAAGWVCELLATWAGSRDPSLMWSAGASIWRVYDSLPAGEAELREALVASLERIAADARSFDRTHKERALELARRQVRGDGDVARLAREQLKAWAKETERSALYAIERLAALDPPATVRALNRWLAQDSSGSLCRFARKACRRLFATLRAAAAFEVRLELLDLIEPLLEVVGANSLEAATLFAALARWLNHPREAGGVVQHLVRIADRAPAPAAFAMACGIARFWLTGVVSDQAARIGRQLIARSLALAGAPPPAPGEEHCLLVLDGALPGRGRAAGSRLASRLGERLALRFEVSVRILGRHRHRDGGKGTWSEVPLESAGRRPRLLAPALDGMADELQALVVILSTGEVLDLDDVCAASRWPRLVILRVDDPDGLPGEAVPTFRINSRAPEDGLEALERWIDAERARNLADADLGPWLAGLRAGLAWPIDEHQPAILTARLTRGIGALERHDWAVADEEPMSLLLRGILRLAAIDLGACASLIGSWLAGGRAGELQWRAAVAAGTLLFRVAAYRRPAPPASATEALLALAAALGGAEWAAAEAVLEAFRRWLEDPTWSAALLRASGSGGDPLARWVEDLVPRYAPQLRATLAAWRLPLEPGSGGPPEAVRQAAERLQRLVARGVSSEGADAVGPAGLLVVEAGSDGKPHARLAQQAASLLVEAAGAALLRVYRLGERGQVAMGGGASEPLVLLAGGRRRRPRLLAPLLASLDPGQVVFVLVLAVGPILDAADLVAGRWARRLHQVAPPEVILPPDGLPRIELAGRSGSASTLLRELWGGAAARPGAREV